MGECALRRQGFYLLSGLTNVPCVFPQLTQPFELYLSLSPRLPKSAAINAANSVARWVQKEEKQLFLRDAPVF